MEPSNLVLPGKHKKSAKPAPAQLHEHRPHVSTTDQRSVDGRRRTRQRVEEHATQADAFIEDRETMAAADLVDGFTYLLDDSSVDNQPEEAVTDAMTGVKVNVRKKYLATVNPMRVWLPFRDTYLRELLRLDGACGQVGKCHICASDVKPACFRCCGNQCFGLGLVCAECCVEAHVAQPLHFIERWNGTFFEPATLRDIGLTIQLGHSGGVTCSSPHITTQDFVIIHTNGIHTVNLTFCGCAASGDIPYYTQLLRASLWPSTTTQPRTTVTFSLLQLGHNVNCTGKLPAWDLWKALEALTQEHLSMKPPDRYKVLLRVLRQYRHLKMCKRAGRGNEVSGISGTGLGELAIECPACPQPERNLPEKWKDDPKKYLYRLFLALDANFRLRNSIVSTTDRDPSLADGCAYFVPNEPYIAHIRAFVNEEEMSSCSGFQAMFLANLKNVKGLRTTGVVGVTCSRHGVWRANGIGDLQRGERYCNVDAVFASAIRRNRDDLEIVLSYDIVCQWAVQLFKRLRELPHTFEVRLSEGNLIFCIPKFHLWGHIPRKHARYSFNYTPGVGRTHGETIEENWSQSNRAAAQTKQMGPGSRQDTLDDVFSFHNQRVIDSFGRVLSARLVDSIREARIHRDEFTRFDGGMVTFCGRETVDNWLRELLTWEKDLDQPCPYEQQHQDRRTLRDVQLELEKEEYDRILKNTAVAHETSISLFISTGMNIESAQRALAWEVKAQSAGNSYQQLSIQKQRNTIKRQIQKFHGIQQALMPNLAEYLTPEQRHHIDDPASVLAENTKLFFPSELKDSDRVLERACVAGVADAEARVREAECRDALNATRQGLRTRSAGVLFAVRNITGQNPVTRAEGVHKKVQISIKLSTLRYRWARNALFRLRGHGTWENELQILKEEDIRGMNERMLTAEENLEAQRLDDAGLINELLGGTSSADAVVAPGEGRRRPSWIWSSYATPAAEPVNEGEDADPAVYEALKIEWCKARSRMLRFEEEVELLLEEMRRVVAYGRWKATWWRQRAVVPDITGNTAEGIRAFASASAFKEEECAKELEARWAVLVDVAKDLLAGLPVTRVVEIEVEEEDDEGEEDMSTE